MKKIAIVALIATLTSCGSGTTETPATTDSTIICDSASAHCDSTKAADTTAAVK